MWLRYLGWWWLESGRDLGHPVPCPISRGALGEGEEERTGGRGKGWGENGPFPLLNRATLLLGAACTRLLAPVLLPCVSRFFFSRANCAVCTELDLCLRDSCL